MRYTNTARSIAIAHRRTEDIQPAAILATMGMIAALTATWIGMVAIWRGPDAANAQTGRASRT